MKRILFVTLLTLTPLSHFATQQPNNNNLLAHLKDVKNDINKELQTLSQEEQQLQKTLGQDYTVSINIFNAFFTITSLTEVFSKIEQLWLYLICNYMQTIYTINDTDDAIIQQVLITLNIDICSTTVLQNLETNWMQIINTLLIKYCSPTDTRTREEQMNDLVLSANSINLAYIIINQQILTPLLQDVENQINEL